MGTRSRSLFGPRPIVGPALLVVSLIVVGLAVDSSFLFADDFVNFQVAHDLGLTPTLLNDQLFGHWIPGRRLLDWLVQWHRPVSWSLVLAGILIVIGIAALVLRRLVLDLVGSPALAWAAAIVLPLTGGIAGTAQWYSGAAEPLSAMPLTLGALLLQLWFIRSARIWTLVGSVVLLFGSLSFDERAIALYATFPILLLLIEVPRRWKRVILLEALSALALAAYLVAQRYVTHASSPTTRPSWNVLVEFVFHGVIQNALPSAIGLQPRAIPQGVLLIVGLVLLLVIVALLFTRRARIVVAIGWLLSLSVALFAATGWVRAADFGADYSLEPRYAAVLMPAALITMAIIVGSVTQSTSRERVVRLTAAGVIAIATAIGLVSLSTGTIGTAGRAWWTKVDAFEAAHPSAQYFDIETPDSIVPSAFFPASLLSNVGAVLDPGLNVSPTTRTATSFTSSGQAFTAGVAPTGTSVLRSMTGLTAVSAGCWRIDDGVGSLMYDVTPLQTAERSYVQGHVTSANSVDVSIVAATTIDETDKGYGGSADAGRHQASFWFTAGVSRQQIGAIKLSFRGSGQVCLTGLTIGVLAPAGAG